MTGQLRAMTEADLEGVLRLEDELFGEEAWSRQMLTGELRQRASRYYLVAEDGGTITGYGGLLAAGRQADVLTLAVAGDHWGQGIGSALLRALLAEAARRGCTEAFLEVRTDNQRGQQLYRRHGFEPVGVRPGYYQPSGADALVMRRSLAHRDARLSGGGGAPGGEVTPGGGGTPTSGEQLTAGDRGEIRS